MIVLHIRLSLSSKPWLSIILWKFWCIFVSKTLYFETTCLLWHSTGKCQRVCKLSKTTVCRHLGLNPELEVSSLGHLPLNYGPGLDGWNSLKSHSQQIRPDWQTETDMDNCSEIGLLHQMKSLSNLAALGLEAMGEGLSYSVYYSRICSIADTRCCITSRCCHSGSKFPVLQQNHDAKSLPKCK